MIFARAGFEASSPSVVSLNPVRVILLFPLVSFGISWKISTRAAMRMSLP